MSVKRSIPITLIIALGILSMVGPVSTDMYLPGLPRMVTDLGTSAGAVQLTLSLFMIGMAVGQLFWGPFSDRVGRRVPLLTAVIIFATVSVLAPFSVNIWMLVALRLVQGFTGAAGLVISRAVARDTARGTQLAKLFGVIGIISGIAPILSPVLGGVLVDWVGWRGILATIAIIAVIMALATLFFIPESLKPENRIASGGADLAHTAGTVIRDIPFLGYVLIGVFAFGSLFAYISGSSSIIQDIYGYSSQAFTLFFAVNAFVAMLMGTINTMIVGRVRPSTMLRIGVGLLTSGSVAMGVMTLLVHQPPVFAVAGTAMLTQSGMPLIMGNSSTLGLSRHPKGAGIASAIMGFLQFGMAGLVSPMVTITGTVSLQSVGVTMMVCGILTAASLVLTRGERETTFTSSVPIQPSGSAL